MIVPPCTTNAASRHCKSIRCSIICSNPRRVRSKMPPVLLLPEKESFHWNPATSDIRDRLLILHNFSFKTPEILLPEIFTDQIRLFLKQQPSCLSAAKHWTCDDLLRTTQDISCLPRQDGLICSSDIPSFQIPLCPKMADQPDSHNAPPATITAASIRSSASCRKYPARSPVIPPNCFIAM